ncbi:MAG: K+ transport system, NAD-binding component [Haloquadratum sp. J07HQX50]|nr:MAG: K+ transport system, NAD-binding component [Haloquadratum sp. J07HQX50]
MRIVIIGAGQVGSSIAANLTETHEVVVIDRDANRIEDLRYSLDALVLEGDGTAVGTLEEAGVEEADIIIASTDNDETNIIVCSTAEAIGGAFTIARVKNTEYLRTWQRSDRAFGVDFMVCTNLLAGESIVRTIGLPAARDVDPFANGEVQMAEFEIDESSPLAGQTVEQADQFSGLTFAAVLKDGDVEIPRGDTALQIQDHVVVIGSPESVKQFATTANPTTTTSTGEVVIIGGSEIGFHVARLLQNQGYRPRLVERDPTRARELANELSNTVVMESDATDVEFLEREHIGDASVLVTALDSDEKNLLISLLASQVGVDRTVSVVDTPEYVTLFEAVGVDIGINPRELVAEEITRFTREGGAENVAVIGSNKAEVLEIEVDTDSVLAGREIREAVSDLPAGVVFGAVTRDDEFIAPRGDTIVSPGDHVVLFSQIDVVEEVAKRA